MMSNTEKGLQKREDIYNVIVGFIKQYKFPPTVREICNLVGFKSTSSAYAHLTRLQIDGRLNFIEESPRTITVPGYAFIKIPEGMTEKEVEMELQSICEKKKI